MWPQIAPEKREDSHSSMFSNWSAKIKVIPIEGGTLQLEKIRRSALQKRNEVSHFLTTTWWARGGDCLGLTILFFCYFLAR